jgi:hypothetical protein
MHFESSLIMTIYIDSFYFIEGISNIIFLSKYKKYLCFQLLGHDMTWINNSDTANETINTPNDIEICQCLNLM